jgi:thiol-disulfide isomerase/thioredoxin
MRRIALALAAVALLAAGCTATQDAVAGGGDFVFVAPNGRTTIAYDDPASRQRIGALSGESLLEPGRTIGLDDYAGRVVVLNVWGSWCGPCREEAPDLQFVAEQTAAQGVAVLGIDVRDDRAAATDFLRDRGITYDSIFDPPGRSLAALGGLPRNVVPLTVVLDAQHRVAWITLLQVRPSELLPVVQRVAAESAPA